MNRKCLVAVAPVSAEKHFLDADKIAEDVYKCYLEGASMVHLHARMPEDGHLTPEMDFTRALVSKIREKCDIVIEISTGGVSNLTIEERCMPIYQDFTEAVSLNVGSVNLGEAVYQNPIKDVRYCVSELLKYDKRPEIEVFELGMINTVKELDEQFGFVDPVLFALVFGHGGEMPSTKAALHHMLGYLKELFIGDGKQVLWGYTQAGRKDWEMMEYALSLGANSVRIGFEDSKYLGDGTLSEDNASIVREMKKLLIKNNIEPMTPKEVRALLKIKER